MTTLTHIKKVKLADLNQQQAICQLLDFTELEYCQNQYDKGLAYAKHQVDGDDFGYQVLIRSKSFWAYWKNEYAKREKEFIRNYKDFDLSYLGEEYEFIHSVDGIKCSRPAEYIEKEFAALWGQVWREVRHA